MSKLFHFPLAFFICGLIGTSRIFCAPETYFEEASSDQAEFLTQLAMDSNATYGYRNVSDQEVLQVFLVKEEHFKKGLIRLMKKGSEIIGFYGLMNLEEKEGKQVHTLSHLFLKPKFIGKGYGRILFQEAMRTAREELQWEALLWESDPHAEWFYRKMGAKKVGENPCPLNPFYKSSVFVYILN